MNNIGKALAVLALAMAGSATATPAQAAASAGVDTRCYAPAIGASCQQLVQGGDQYIQDRGSAIQFECVAAIPDTRVLAVTINKCVARDAFSGEEVRGLQNGTNTPTSATVGISTTDAPRGLYKVCMTTEYLTIQGAEELPEFCSTIRI